MKKDITGIIRNDIIHLRFKPGDPLSENRLAEEFKVSRTPIREALHRLSLEGLVTITPNLGARVSDINLRDFQELIEFRIILERGLARLVARNATGADIQAMEQLHKRIQREKTDDLDKLTDFDTEFHNICRQAGHNRLLEDHMAMIQTKFTWVMRMISYKPALLMVELPNFKNAMEKRDESAMAHILVEHVEFFVEKMQKETIKAFA
jgi:DNA-binding GntR family transcriptional regulator